MNDVKTMAQFANFLLELEIEKKALMWKIRLFTTQYNEGNEAVFQEFFKGKNITEPEERRSKHCSEVLHHLVLLDISLEKPVYNKTINESSFKLYLELSRFQKVIRLSLRPRVITFTSPLIKVDFHCRVIFRTLTGVNLTGFVCVWPGFTTCGDGTSLAISQ